MSCKSRSGLINIFRVPVYQMFSALFVSCTPLKSPPSQAPVWFDIYPVPSFLCVRVNVEMTSIVELFSGRFSFSVKSGMWTSAALSEQLHALHVCCHSVSPAQSLIQTLGWNTAVFSALHKITLRTQTFSGLNWFLFACNCSNNTLIYVIWGKWIITPLLRSLESFSCVRTLTSDLFLTGSLGGWDKGSANDRTPFGRKMNSGPDWLSCESSEWAHHRDVCSRI